MKLVVKLKGSLAYEPAIGERMIILEDGKEKYYTSPIKAIRKRMGKGLELETKNTIYKITYERGEKTKRIA